MLPANAFAFNAIKLMLMLLLQTLAPHQWFCTIYWLLKDMATLSERSCTQTYMPQQKKTFSVIANLGILTLLGRHLHFCFFSASPTFTWVPYKLQKKLSPVNWHNYYLLIGSFFWAYFFPTILMNSFLHYFECFCCLLYFQGFYTKRH